MSTTRTAGLAALTFSLTTFVAGLVTATPGGSYEPSQVSSYIAGNHHLPAFLGGYLGLIGAVALIVFGAALRRELTAAAPAAADAVWGLAVAAAATATVGWTLASGIPVAYAEGGKDVALSSPTVYVLGEIAALASWAVPAILVGAALFVIAARVEMLPTWLRRSTYVAGVCGVTAPLFFPYFLFLLWGVVFGLRLLVSPHATAPEPVLA